MNTPQQYHACVALAGKIYTIGGYEDAAFEEYDPSTDHWTKKADMPTPRGFFGAATAKGFVFAIAGRVRGEPPVERYDSRSDTWKPLGTMPGQSRNRFGIAMVEERIYIVGGEPEQDRSVPFTVWRYKPDR